MISGNYNYLYSMKYLYLQLGLRDIGSYQNTVILTHKKHLIQHQLLFRMVNDSKLIGESNLWDRVGALDWTCNFTGCPANLLRLYLLARLACPFTVSSWYFFVTNIADFSKFVRQYLVTSVDDQQCFDPLWRSGGEWH